MIRIRKLKIEDIEKNQDKLEKLLFMVLSENLKECNPDELSKKYYQDMITFAKDGSAVLIGAYDEGVLIGFHWGYELSFLGKRRMHLYHTAIEPDYRGRHIGSDFLRKLEEISLARGIDEIEAMCTASNENAVQYYIHNGFEIERYKMLKKII